jgi:hypothetical protein
MTDVGQTTGIGLIVFRLVGPGKEMRPKKKIDRRKKI